MNLGTFHPVAAHPAPGDEWRRLTLGSALVATTLDAALLERSKGFFTGGFLAVDHVRSPLEAILFVGASLLADAALAGILVALALVVLRPFHLTRAARGLAVLVIALGPFAIANFVSYQLHEYLGDAFDIGLMFDLTDRRPEEFVAVASSHLAAPLALFAAGALAAAGLVWAVDRFGPGTRAADIPAPGATRWRLAVFLFVAGLLSTALLRAGTDVMENGLRRKPSGKFLGAIAEFASDVDRDGFGAIARMSDPDPFDGGVFPWAIDIPGNGIDENGIGGDLPAIGVPDEDVPAAPPAFTSRPDIVLIVLESFRADALGATVDGKPVTPALNELAAGGISSALAFSHNGYTAQSRHHLFTGTLAGIRGRTSLIDDFKANGYEVAYFSGQDESFGGPEFSIGFERADVAYDARTEPHRRYSTFSTAGSLAVPFAVVLEKVNAFLSARESSKPLLLYVNFHDTHFPYHHEGVQPLVSTIAIERGAISPRRHDELRTTYLNTAANVDRAVGGVLSSARQHLPAPPGVIVTADHGESLYDEGFLGHGYALNDIQTRIPFIASGLPLRIAEPFGQADLRDNLHAALAVESSGAGLPAIVRDPQKRVFQYLGTIRRPRQIGFLHASGERTIYDFNERKVRAGRGEWTKPEDLDGEGRTEFFELVHFWERLAAARAAAR